MAEIDCCRVCRGKQLVPVFDLGMQPWANNFLEPSQIGTENVYPLRVVFCETCSLAQLDYTVEKEVMFSDHTYLSGMTQTLSDHFKSLASYINNTFGADFKAKTILDIGSNDGTQLRHYIELGWRALGVESSKRVSDIANLNGVPTVNDFFNERCIEKINDKFSVINASGVFFHLEELHSVTSAVRQALDADGVFVVQFLYVPSIFKNVAFDQIYHEHLLYYSLQSLSYLLALHDLEIFDSFLTSIHGGQMIALVSHKGRRKKTKRFNNYIKDEERNAINEISSYQKFALDVEDLRQKNVEYLQNQKSLGKTIYGLGAPVKGNTLLNYFDIGSDIVEVLVEKNELRKGLYSPGKHIPVVMEDEIKASPDIYYVLAWNFKAEILNRHSVDIQKGTEFFFPIDGDR